jgi:hypothetical protein
LDLSSLIRPALLGTALVLIAGLTFVSLGPHFSQGGLPHRVEHVIAFGVLALVVLPLGRSRGEKWILVSAIFLIAGMLEMRQHQIFRQPFEWWDIRDDGVGVAMACLLVRNRRRTSQP